MIKIIALIQRRPEMSLPDFLSYWEHDHAPFVRRLPGIRRYRQNHPVAHHTPWPYDGAAEVWFDSKADIARAFSSPEADEMREDEQRFIGEMSWFLVEEREIELSEGESA